MESKNLYTITATVRIKKGQGRTLKAGGAWIYDNEIDAITGEFQNGELVSVEDFDGFFLGLQADGAYAVQEKGHGHRRCLY